MPTVPVSSSSGSGGATLITSSVLSGSAASIDFTGIAGGYSALHVVGYWRGDTAANSTVVLLTINGDNGANYHAQRLSGSAASSGAAETLNGTSAQIANMPANNAVASYFGVGSVLIPQYAATVGFKPLIATTGFVVGTASGNAECDQFFNHWRSSSAITHLNFAPAAGNFVAGTAIFVYGLS